MWRDLVLHAHSSHHSKCEVIKWQFFLTLDLNRAKSRGAKSRVAQSRETHFTRKLESGITCGGLRHQPINPDPRGEEAASVSLHSFVCMCLSVWCMFLCVSMLPCVGEILSLSLSSVCACVSPEVHIRCLPLSLPTFYTEAVCLT